MAEKMRAALMQAVRQMSMGEKDKPACGDNEVLVNVKHVGICGADQEFFKDGYIGGWVLSFPHVLGHEPAGIVAEVGKNVKGLKVGDKVAVEPGKPCFTCPTCRKGLYNLCPDVQFMSVPGVPGAFCDYVAWPQELVYKLPDNVSTADGCLAEPLAVAIHSVEQSGIKLGQSAAILGSGCIGLCVAMVLLAQGITEVYMTDHHPIRMAKAKEIGVKAVFNDHEEDIVKAIGSVDVIYECTGSEKAITQAIQLMNKGGMLTLIGLFGTPAQPVDLNLLIMKEGAITTNFRYRHNYPAAIEGIASGKMPVAKIVSHRFPLDQLGEALALNIDQKKEVTKIVIEI